MQIRRTRLGSFFLVISVIFFVIFFTSDQSMQLQPLPLFGGVLAAFIGFYLIRKDWKPAPPTQRFAALRKMRQKQAEAKEKRKQKQQAAQKK